VSIKQNKIMTYAFHLRMLCILEFVYFCPASECLAVLSVIEHVDIRPTFLCFQNITVPHESKYTAYVVQQNVIRM